jgi:hypothetical protein
MANESEVKIHVAGSADLQQIEAAQKKIKDLYRAAAVYEEKGITTAAASARADARSLERDVARFTRERAQAERAVTREVQEQNALRKAGVGQGSVLGRVLSSGGVGLMAGEVFSAVIDQMAAGEMLANRKVASQAGSERQRGILSGWRGSPGQLMASSWAAEDEAAQLQRDRPKLETEQTYGTAKAAMEGAAWGGGIGAAVGSVVPGLGTAIGAGIGATIGAAVRGIPAYLEGGNKIKQSEQDEALAREKAQKDAEAARERYRNVEGGMEIGALRGRSKRTMEGQMEAFTEEMTAKALAKYTEAKQKGATEDMARETATLTFQNDIRERQATAGAGLVDARSGGAGIAAAAQWGMSVVPQEERIGARLDTLIGEVNKGNQTAEREKLHK